MVALRFAPGEAVSRYVGGELELFEAAANWKSYWTSRILAYVAGDVLEVGAGIGANTRTIAPRASFSRWTCLEPDPTLAQATRRALSAARGEFHVVCGTIDCLRPADAFDSILYFDVLEHIEEDAAELLRAWGRLRPRGHLVVVSPAHQFLYSPFDRQIGHIRRYDKARLREIAPEGCAPAELYYLDSVGMIASWANKALLRKSLPSLDQVLFWDRVLVRASTVVDPLFLGRLGKSVVCVWKKEPIAER